MEKLLDTEQNAWIICIYVFFFSYWNIRETSQF